MHVPELDVTISPVEHSIISFQSGHNSIVINYTSDTSLIYEEVRITKNPVIEGPVAGESTTGSSSTTDEPDMGYDIGVGVLAHFTSGSIAANVQHTINIPVNATNFSEGNGDYTISLYVKSAIDGSWNEYHFFITVDEEDFKTYGYNDFMVVTDQAIPS